MNEKVIILSAPALMLWHSLATKVVDGKRTHLDCKEVPVISR